MSGSLISGRLTERLDPLMLELVFGKKIDEDAEANLLNLLWINRAHSLMLFEQGIIDADTAREIARGIDLVEDEKELLELDPNREDLYFNVEHAISLHTGSQIGGMIHVGRSRNDLYATMSRMRTRDKVMSLSTSLAILVQKVVKMAEQSTEVIMPGFTHLQPAQPITVGHYFMAIASALTRDFERILRSLKSINLSPMGAAALAGTGFPINRDAVARYLGFDGLVINTLDAIASRDFLLEVVAASSILSTTLSRFAQDVFIWLTYDFGFATLRDRVSGTSSIMPQKKNPALIETLKGRSSQSIGALVAAMTSINGTNFSNVLDATTEPFTLTWSALDSIEECVRLAGLTIDNIEFDEERMAAHAEGDFTTVTQLADLLVNTWKVSFRDAHEVVGAVVANSISSGMLANQINVGMIEQAAVGIIDGHRAPLSEVDVARALDPSSNIHVRDHTGGPAPKRVIEHVQSLSESLAGNDRCLNAVRDKVASSQRLTRDRLSEI